MIEHRNTKKVKFAIQTEGYDRTYIAGLYRYENHGGMQIPMFSILTREASGSVRDIHDRMPLILPEKKIDEWITPSVNPDTLLPHSLTDMVMESCLSD